MRIGIATVYTPSVYGGAEFLADGLANALGRAGHRVHRMIAPFHYGSLDAVGTSMAQWQQQNFEPYGGGLIDRMVFLKFPSYLANHPDSIAWLLHQHRPAHDLFGTPQGFQDDPQGRLLRDKVHAADRDHLSRLSAIFTIAGRVSERLLASTGIQSEPLYHPPHAAEAFCCEPAEPYVLVPSRIEHLKRQRLLIEAMAHVRAPFTAVIVGDGGDRMACEALAEKLGISSRIRFLGAVSREQLLRLYAKASAVFFGPRDEDYGYVTLEAMLAAKPVITCDDSGGPLEFVIDRQTGLVASPEAVSVAEALEWIFADPARAAALGKAGLAHYREMDISWEAVVERLVASRPQVSRAWRTPEPAIGSS